MGSGALDGAVPELTAVFEEARALHLLGPAPVADHLDHARAWIEGLEEGVPAARASAWVDLGSGAGVPGLVVALAWPESQGWLLESQAKRAGFLERAGRRLEIEDRVRVVHDRAEAVARQADHREAHDLVLARAFGPPATTAECATGLLAVGGALSVSEPPDGATERWDPAGLHRLGFGPAERIRRGSTAFVVVRKVAPTTTEYPRRVGVPAKRPLWGASSST